MNPDFSRLTPPQALAVCDLIASQVQEENPFDLSETTLDALQAARGLLASAAQGQLLAEADLRMRVGAKDDALQTTRRTLGAIAKTALASPASDADLRLIGMARPAKPTRPTAIPAPTDLLATVLAESRTKLVFGRGGTAYGATHEIFMASDGITYTMIATTTRASLILENQPAGRAAWYKVRAARSGLLSPFSNVATLYASSASAPVQLNVA